MRLRVIGLIAVVV